MKTVFFSIILLLGAATAFSQVEQEELAAPTVADYSKNQFHVYGSFGYAGSVYQGMEREYIHRNFSLVSALDFRYARFFNPAWGFSIGAGLSQFAAKGTLNIPVGIIERYDDPDFDPSGRQRYFDLHFSANDLVEQQRIWALEVPLQLHYAYRFSESYGIFSGLGVKGYFPVISAKSLFPHGAGSLSTLGYEDFTDAWYPFGTRDARGAPANVKLRPSVDVIADFGWTISLSPSCDLYLGVYGSYGLMDIRPEAKNRKDFITREHGDTYTVNSLLAYDVRSDYNKYVADNNLNWSTINKDWVRWQAGIKVGLHFKGGAKQPRQRGRSYPSYDEERSPVIVRDTVQIIYVYNITPAGNTNNDNLTSGERENILSLVEALSSSKIYFDIDSDVPKIDDTGFIVPSAEILQREPSLRLLIEGYTCDLGREAHNRELALRRANAVKDLFVRQGVNPSQVRVAGYIVSDSESRHNIRETSREGHRAVIFRIVKD